MTRRPTSPCLGSMIMQSAQINCIPSSRRNLSLSLSLFVNHLSRLLTSRWSTFTPPSSPDLKHWRSRPVNSHLDMSHRSRKRQKTDQARPRAQSAALIMSEDATVLKIAALQQEMQDDVLETTPFVDLPENVNAQVPNQPKKFEDLPGGSYLVINDQRCDV